MGKIVLVIFFTIFLISLQVEDTFPAEVTVSVSVAEIFKKEIPSRTTDTFLVSIATGTGREILLEIPAGTFLSTTTLVIERRTDLPAPDGLKQPNLKGTGIGIEITLSSAATLNRPITVTLSYQPAIFTREENLTLARFYQEENTWQFLSSHLDIVNKKISAPLNRFSIFQIVETVASLNPDNIFVYPNPCYLNREKKITFTRLPANAEIIVYTLNGEKIAHFSADDSGYHTWIPDNIASGIYIFLAKDPLTGKKKTGKFAIIK